MYSTTILKTRQVVKLIGEIVDTNCTAVRMCTTLKQGCTQKLYHGTKKRFSELVTELDCYIGRTDGNAYKSYDRLVQMRKKGIFKPVEPNEMYKYPGTDAMKASFWRRDPALKNQDWYKTRIFEPKPQTDISKYVDDMKKIDKFFKL